MCPRIFATRCRSTAPGPRLLFPRRIRPLSAPIVPIALIADHPLPRTLLLTVRRRCLNHQRRPSLAVRAVALTWAPSGGTHLLSPLFHRRALETDTGTRTRTTTRPSRISTIRTRICAGLTALSRISMTHASGLLQFNERFLSRCRRCLPMHLYL